MRECEIPGCDALSLYLIPSRPCQKDVLRRSGGATIELCGKASAAEVRMLDRGGAFDRTVVSIVVAGGTLCGQPAGSGHELTPVVSVDREESDQDA